MSAATVGDHAKVQLAGQITHIDPGGARVESGGYAWWFPIEALTVEAKPVEVGDEVTPEQADTLPGCSVVYGALAYEKSYTGSWYAAGAGNPKRSMAGWVGENCKLVVLQVGEA